MVSVGCLNENKFFTLGHNLTHDHVVLSAYKSPKYDVGQYGKHARYVLLAKLYLYRGHVDTHLNVYKLAYNAGVDGQFITHFR